jgi:uncharacterized membrane protein YgaE (UPF0421/DUF939 family)
MKKEIHRMELRKADLEKVKEQLMKELERAVEKRDTISIKGRANAANSKKAGKLTEKQLGQRSKELQQSIADTEAECTATDRRNDELDKQRIEFAERMHTIIEFTSSLRAQDDETRKDLHQLFQAKAEKALQQEALSQGISTLQSGKFRQDQSLMVHEQAIQEEQEKIISLLESLSTQNSDFALEADSIKLHITAIPAV